MPIELMLILVLVGAVAGAISSLTDISPTFVAIPVFYFFLPVFDLSFERFMLPIIATCIVAFIPVHLYSWIKSMKRQEVDFQQLVYFAPGIALGGVIGAQLLSLVNINIFKVAFSGVALLAIMNTVLSLRTASFRTFNMNKSVNVFLGLAVGTVSILSGDCGRTLGERLLAVNGSDKPLKKNNTASGFVVFASIAGMVGFIFPANAFEYLDLTLFAGAIHLLSLLFLAVSHGLFYWFCHNRGSDLDRRVLSMSLIVFIVCTLVRFWL